MITDAFWGSTSYIISIKFVVKDRKQNRPAILTGGGACAHDSITRLELSEIWLDNIYWLMNCEDILMICEYYYDYCHDIACILKPMFDLFCKVQVQIVNGQRQTW